MPLGGIANNPNKPSFIHGGCFLLFMATLTKQHFVIEVGTNILSLLVRIEFIQCFYRFDVIHGKRVFIHVETLMVWD